MRSCQGLLISSTLKRIPILGIDERLGAAIGGIRRGIDQCALARFRVPIIEGNHGLAKVAFWLHSLISWKRTGSYHRGIHAGRLPPEAAAPGRRAPVRLLVAHD